MSAATRQPEELTAGSRVIVNVREFSVFGRIEEINPVDLEAADLIRAGVSEVARISYKPAALEPEAVFTAVRIGSLWFDLNYRELELEPVSIAF